MKLMALWICVAGLSAQGLETRVPVVFSGGHETNPVDHGRPVVLVAAGLNVPPEVFREAFSHVKPAPAGQEPKPGQVDLNKQALLHALGKYGVTNALLDRVSDYYRYNGRDGELWRHTPAEAYAAWKDGKVTGIVLTRAGAGYTSATQVTVGGKPVAVVIQLAFSQELSRNGSIASIALQ